MRDSLREFLRQPLFTPRYHVSMRFERELALERLQRLCDAGYISVLDFWKDPRRIFAAHEIGGIPDGSCATKMTVQFNLFGGTVLKLGRIVRIALGQQQCTHGIVDRDETSP